MKRVKLLLMFAMFLLLTACGRQEISEPVEVTEFTLPDNYCPMSIEEVETANQAYVLGYNGDTYDYFVFDKTENGYGAAEKLKIENEDLVMGNLSVSEDGEKAYFWAWNWTEENETEINIYQGDLVNHKLVNIEGIQELNTSLYNLLGDVDRDGNLYILNLKEQLYDTYIASKEGDNYKKTKLDLGMNSKYIANVTCLEKNKVLYIIRDENGYFESIYVSELEDGVSTKSIEIELPEELQGKEIYNISINDKSGIIYFVIQKAQDNFLENKIYKMSLNPFLKGAVKEKNQEYQKESCDDYDTGEFEMQLRNKGDMSKKQGIYYEIFVRSFADSDGDGIGDFNGVTAKLDYLKELGVDGIWLMPVNASPSYHGYDVTDYNSLNEDYGTEAEFQNLLEQAHKRDIKVIMDFVINHTSSEHPWFQSAVADVNSQYRNYYRWVNKKDTADYSLSDESSWNSQVWHKSGDYYFYGIFSEEMPDLNYNNELVREEIKNAAKKWLTFGVDGFRLDAARHIYGDHEFKQQKDQLQANIQWWNEFALFCESINPQVYLVGEAWEDEKVLAEYAQPFDTKFNFTFAQDMMNAIINESTEKTSTGKELAKSLEDILQQYKEQDEKYIDGIFATNHDQDRIMSQVGSVEKAKLASSIYLTLPGNPFIYYGEEIGMCGEKPDEKIREPFKWSLDGSDMDTTWEEASSNTKTLSLQELKSDSTNNIYHHYQKLIAFRKEHQVLADGEFQAIETGKKTILAYSRKNQEEELMVLHNLSKEQVEIQNEMLKEGIILYDESLESKEGNTWKEDSILLAPHSTMVVKILP